MLVEQGGLRQHRHSFRNVQIDVLCQVLYISTLRRWTVVKVGDVENVQHFNSTYVQICPDFGTLWQFQQLLGIAQCSSSWCQSRRNQGKTWKDHGETLEKTRAVPAQMGMLQTSPNHQKDGQFGSVHVSTLLKTLR